MVHPLRVKLPGDLDQQLMSWAGRNGLTRSQATRELLRQALGHADPIKRGWFEGFADGQRQVLEAQCRAAAQVKRKAG